LITKLGTDSAATFLADKLEKENVDTQHIAYSDSHKTGSIIISVNDIGERNFTYMQEPSADSQLERSDIPAFTRDDWLCVSSFVLSQPSSREATFFAIEQAQAAKAFICVDANMRADRWDDKALLVTTTLRALKTAGVAKMSEDEMLLLTNKDSVEEGVAQVKQWPATIKIITRAEKGAILVTEQSEFHIEGYDVPVVDMTGAGDAFVAAFISKLMLLQTWSDAQLIEAIEFSNACGALVVGKMGAMSALPTTGTVTKFLSKKGQNVDTKK